MLEAVQEDPSLLGDLETRRQAVLRCQAPQGEMPQRVRVPPDGVLVRSMGEARIASTLHLAGIDYRYEAEFPLPDEHRSDKGERYFPDFYLPDQPEESSNEHGPAGAQGGVWLEHFANDANGKLPERWDEDDPGATRKYRRTRAWKGDAAPNAREPASLRRSSATSSAACGKGRRSPTWCSPASPLRARPGSSPRHSGTCARSSNA